MIFYENGALPSVSPIEHFYTSTSFPRLAPQKLCSGDGSIKITAMAEEATSGASGTGAPGEAIYVSDDAETSRPASQASSFLVEFNHEENTPPDLRGALDGIKPAGSFASFNTLSSLNLGLAVQDVGTIAMPLQEPQAKQIIEKARRSPYGKGEETVVDMSVRNTWELDPDQFELQGTGWESLLTVMLGHVKKSLGVASPIRAELYKMLLYEPGAMFKSHTEWVAPKRPQHRHALGILTRTS